MRVARNYVTFQNIDIHQHGGSMKFQTLGSKNVNRVQTLSVTAACYVTESKEICLRNHLHNVILRELSSLS
jgi:hypothetical protein